MFIDETYNLSAKSGEIQMKSIKVLVMGLVLGVAGVVYAAGQAQTTSQACDMDKASASCCNGGSCCMGGSCCGAKIAKR